MSNKKVKKIYKQALKTVLLTLDIPDEKLVIKRFSAVIKALQLF